VITGRLMARALQCMADCKQLGSVAGAGFTDYVVKLKLDPGRPREPMVHGFRRELRNVLAGGGETGKECDNHSTFRG